MGWWSYKRRSSREAQKHMIDDNWGAYLEVQKAQWEWERARLMFDEAAGEDQIDYAIYILEAAERKYQIHLKHAKLLGLNRSQMQSEER
ncbi:hypothetical protein [Paenibacillus wynnii]|uniref:DUF2508 domain-containing protein n=1 Tax=Paenibacillus wynnii TaxID=268407 RepID=A0A098MBE4_9BACL|nr:hypothetical protein [Paenibacillus wynnii]KGE19869.1 hypothetical protein PWYN_11400 [Paenibacillus wynnii]